MLELVYPSWTNIDVLTAELVKTAGNNTGSDYRANGKKTETNTEVLTTELNKNPGTNNDVLITGLVQPSGLPERF